MISALTHPWLKLRYGFLISLATLAFVGCWGSGYLAARFTEEYYEPFNLLFVRYTATTIIVFTVTLYKYQRSILRVIYREQIVIQIILGILYHVVYIGCVFYAVKLGLSAGVTALILATQPLLTILFHSILEKKCPTKQIIAGTIICLFGSFLVIEEAGFQGASFNYIAITVAIIGVLAICVATIIHGRSVKTTSLWPALLIQFAIGTLGVGALLLSGAEVIHINASNDAILFVTFLVFITTLGSYILMAWLIKTIPTSQYSNIFYIVPPAVMGAEYALYGEIVTLSQILGGIMIFTGIYVGFKSQKT